MNNKILKKVIAVLCATTISASVIVHVGASLLPDLTKVDVAELYYGTNDSALRNIIINQALIPRVDRLREVFEQYNIRDVFDTETDYYDPMYWEGCLNFVSQLSVDDMHRIANYIVNRTGSLVPKYFDVYYNATVSHSGPYTTVSCSPLTMLDLIRDAIQKGRVNILSETRKAKLHTVYAI